MGEGTQGDVWDQLRAAWKADLSAPYPQAHIHSGVLDTEVGKTKSTGDNSPGSAPPSSANESFNQQAKPFPIFPAQEELPACSLGAAAFGSTDAATAEGPSQSTVSTLCQRTPLCLQALTHQPQRQSVATRLRHANTSQHSCETP